VGGRSAGSCCFERAESDFYCLDMKAGMFGNGRERDAISTLCGAGGNEAAEVETGCF